MVALVNGERPRLIDPTTNAPFDLERSYAVAPVLTHASILNQSLQVYSAIRRDDAMKFGRKDALAMERDAFLQAIMLERYEATALLKWQVDPEDPKDPVQIADARWHQKILERTPNFQQYRMSNLYAIWFGRAGVQHVIHNPKSELIGGRPAWRIVDHSPIRGDKIEFTFQMDQNDPQMRGIREGMPVVLVNGSYTGEIERKGGRIIRSDQHHGLLLTDGYWRERFCIHKHLTKDWDPFEEPERQGNVHGYGVRDQIFWMDWVRKEWLANVSDFIDQVGKGCQIYPYDASNPQNEAKAIAAAKSQSRNTVIVWPVWPGQTPVLPQPMNTPMDGSRVLLELMQHMETIIERYIIGQSASSSSETSGMGTHSTGFQEDCVPVEGSEILTRTGFKSAHEVLEGEEVLAYDCETDTTRWTPLLGKTFYSDRAVSRLHIDGKNTFDATCTPEHSWAVVNKYHTEGVRGNEAMRFVGHVSLKKANELTRSDTIIVAAPELETEESLLTPTEAALLGWAVADGPIQLVMSYGAYQWKGSPTIRTFPTGNTSVCQEQRIWLLPRAASNDLLRKSGYREKSDLPGIVTRLSYAARNAMLDAMICAEGDEKRRFASKNRKVMEAFEILCLMQGISTGPTIAKETCDVKGVRSTRLSTGQKRHMEHAGMADIWCPSTKYGTWIMRQNGRVMITGNTKYRRVRWDAQNLDETLTEQTLGPLHRLNNPQGARSYKLFIKSQIDKPNGPQMVAAAGELYQMNVPVKTDEVLSYAGFTKPEPGDAVVQQPQMPMVPSQGPPQGV